jgi:hypothetical protein
MLVEQRGQRPPEDWPDSTTNITGSCRSMSHKVIATAFIPNAISIVFSRPIRSDIHPNIGRVTPFATRSIASARGSAARPKTVTSDMPD